MAKKIRLDFSSVKERPVWNTRLMPEGVYKATITAVQETSAQDGTPMLVYSIKPSNKTYCDRNFPYYCKLQQNQLWKLRDLLISAGQQVPKRSVQVDPGSVVGKSIAISVADDKYREEIRSTVTSVFPLSAVDLEEVSAGDAADDTQKAPQKTPETPDDLDEFDDLDNLDEFDDLDNLDKSDSSK